MKASRSDALAFFGALVVAFGMNVMASGSASQAESAEMVLNRQPGPKDVDAWGPKELERVSPPGGWQDPVMSR